ncbi:dipeptide epimerase [Flavobacterium weaverense]|uniref:Dipeptide epimerase n=1 Tax=Flavobacterium weaverense TaxID=271156 RepID=A0A3L9ZZB1_9FLAO|nr:dipeptide epimerase [Flavobacterium weaverense]RMA77687.1 L-alanine-DL-glutamate epimerase-like enolase superfamily enzyme [Flavobacterium weaverense]
MISIEIKPYLLHKKHVFRIAAGARTNTPILLIKLKYDYFEGYGEASMPPLYGENIVSATQFINTFDFSRFSSPLEIEAINNALNQHAEGNPAIKAAIDIALHDLIGKMKNMPLYEYFNLPKKELKTSKTIGIDTAEIIKQRVLEAAEFHFLKIKLGGHNDAEIINAVRSVSDKPLFIDANQGWTNKEEARDKIEWLKQEGAVFIEQPMPKIAFNDMEWLAAHSTLPLIGDEGIQKLEDVKTASNFYHGINIKLMKSAGLQEAFAMANLAKSLNLKIMLGCMSETSCAIAAASHLGAMADWIDLDGNLGVTNDPFQAHQIINGHIQLNDTNGIGLVNPDWNKIENYE